MDWIILRARGWSSHRIVRFALVGLSNTLVNFVILNAAFYLLGVHKIAANIIATSCALVYSFILNRTFVFAHTGRWFKLFIRFAAVTAVGTLLLNNAVYIIMLQFTNGAVSTSLSRLLHGFGLPLSPDFVHINVSAAIATCFSMVWNYVGYRFVVFCEVPVNE